MGDLLFIISVLGGICNLDFIVVLISVLGGLICNLGFIVVLN